MAARKKFITINNVKYPVKEFNFNLLCDLEDLGFSFEEIGTKPMSMVRAYAGICMNIDSQIAGKELEAHLINGGNFDEIMEVISTEMENSDFFRSINKTAEAEN